MKHLLISRKHLDKTKDVAKKLGIKGRYWVELHEENMPSTLARYHRNKAYFFDDDNLTFKLKGK